jgi:hypothetical protein
VQVEGYVGPTSAYHGMVFLLVKVLVQMSPPSKRGTLCEVENGWHLGQVKKHMLCTEVYVGPPGCARFGRIGHTRVYPSYGLSGNKSRG